MDSDDEVPIDDPFADEDNGDMGPEPTNIQMMEPNHEDGHMFGNADEDGEDETELVVLDPDHPLMQRFQNALKNMLTKQLERVDIECKEFSEGKKRKAGVHLDLGNELYNIQQELAKQQMLLERNHDLYSTTRQARQHTEGGLDEMRHIYSTMQTTLAMETKKASELRNEVDNLSLRYFYMKNAQEDVRGDIAVMRRAAEKVETDVSKAERDKMSQDLLVDRLVERVDRLSEEIALYDAQMSAQGDERSAAQTTLREAQLEIEAIKMERKQLMSQWNSSLIGLQRRNEAHAVMNDSLNQCNEKILSLNTELEGYKKSISAEQEQNEKLTLLLNKTQGDIASVKKLMAQSSARYDELKSKYSTYTRMLHETESALYRANGDKAARTTEIDALRKQIEKENLARVGLEDQITAEMRSRLTLKKAAEYTARLTGKLKDLSRDMEAEYAMMENERARCDLEITQVQSELAQISKIVGELDLEIESRNGMIGRLETEINRNVVVIERRQSAIDQLNKKLEGMIQGAGGVELGPLEVTMNSLNKSITAKSDEIAVLEQQWLREQQELVRMVNEKNDLFVAVNMFKKQLTILSQKKMRTEGEIEREGRDRCDVERDLRHLQNDMVKLNGLIYSEHDTQERLEKTNSLVELDFIRALKAAEMENIELKQKLDSLIEEKERLLNSLVESERQIMLWEKRIQLGQETQAAVDSEIGQGEMRAMKSEIHRMEVRFSQLMRQQDYLVQNMEKSVSRRDTIVTRSEAQQKMKQKVVTKGTMQKQIAEIRKKIRETLEAANDCDQDVAMLRANQADLSTHISDRQTHCETLQLEVDQFNEQVQSLADQKHVYLMELQQRQLVSRYYQQLKEAKYTPFFKSTAMMLAEQEKQLERTRSLYLIVDRLSREFPQAMRDLNPVRSLVNQRLGTVDVPPDSAGRHSDHQ